MELSLDVSTFLLFVLLHSHSLIVTCLRDQFVTAGGTLDFTCTGQTNIYRKGYLLKFEEQLTVVKVSDFQCQHAGIYYCAGTGTTGIQEESQVKLVATRSVLANSLDGLSNQKQGYFMQGSTVVITCTVQTTPHPVDWRWEYRCPGGNNYVTTTDIAGLEVEAHNHVYITLDNTDFYCLLSKNMASVTFTMTPSLHGCSFRCQMLNNNMPSEVISEDSVEIFVDWKAKAEGYTEVCSNHGLWAFITGVCTTAVFTALALCSYYKKGAFKKEPPNLEMREGIVL